MGKRARFAFASDVAVDREGNAYVADRFNNTLRKVTPDGVVTTLAGLQDSGGNVDGVGSVARFSGPRGLTIDAEGIIYAADGSIRKITPLGAVSTLACGSNCSAGSDVAVDSAGNVYTTRSEQDNLSVVSYVLKITPAGEVSPLATFSHSYAGANPLPPHLLSSLATHGSNVYVADSNRSVIYKITSGGDVSVLAGFPGSKGSNDGAGARFSSPGGLAVDAAGNLYVADTGNATIRKITPQGVVSTVAGSPGISGSVDGPAANAQFASPQGVAVGASGELYVADQTTIRTISPDGVVATLAGFAGEASEDGPVSDARFEGPAGITFDSARNIYVADRRSSTIRKITPSGIVSTFAGSANRTGSVDGSGAAARFNEPVGVAADSAGNIYVADSVNSTIRKITPDGMVSTFAGMPGMVGSDDGAGGNARFAGPEGVATDSAGNVYVADSYNCTIRKITPNGTVSTFAGQPGSVGAADGPAETARFNFPAGLVVDDEGNVYVADRANFTVRKISPSGNVTTLAGLAGESFGLVDGTGSEARFNSPCSVAIDRLGNLYVVDAGTPDPESFYLSTVRKVSRNGVVSTIAGIVGGLSRDGIGSSVRFVDPRSVAVDTDGAVYVSDEGGDTLNVGTPASPSVTTVGQRFVYTLRKDRTTSNEIVDTESVNNLPPGLTYDRNVSAITGVPTVAGTFVAE